MQKWEYYSTFLNAEAESVQDELKKRFPTEKTFLPFTPRALMPQLDKFGEEGWELVSIQPVQIGKRGDILVHDTYGTLNPAGNSAWTHTYLCSFKRLK